MPPSPNLAHPTSDNPDRGNCSIGPFILHTQYFFFSGLAYFGAIVAFGVEKAVISYSERDNKFTFLQTHLIGCAKEKNTGMFEELMQIISSKPDSQSRIISPEVLEQIIHFRIEADRESIFSKTALSWTIENNDQYMAIELLKLERDCHKDEKEGLECLRYNLNSHELLPWIFETYSKFYDKTEYWSSLRTVVFELVLLSYVPFFMDIYFDISLANSYRKYSSEHFSVTELWSCGDTQLSSSCYEKIGSDYATSYYKDSVNQTFADFKVYEDIQKSFMVAFWFTIFLLTCTVSFYIVCIGFDSSPSWLSSLQDLITRNKYLGNNRCCKQNRIMGWCIKKFLICACKLVWPLVHCGRQLLYLASPKPSQYKQNIDKSTAIWNNIKIVEYGLESSAQLLLQLWLLRPFLPIIVAWDTTELISRCASGLANFFTFEILPACFIEKALAKILSTIFFLSLGISQMKKKPGQNFLETLPMFISIFAQTVGRIVALNSLVLIITPFGYYKYALFMVQHFLLVFLIKTLFEVKSLRDKIVACCKPHRWRKHIWKVIKFITSGISSTIVMIHLRRDKDEWHKKHPLLLSHSAFQVLILAENLLLVCLPFISNGRFYPPDDCFPASSQYSSVCIVILAWFTGAVSQGLHYKFGSPLSQLNGPQTRSWFPPASISCPATLCWKREIQRIEVNGLCQLQCTVDR
jgi:hypothetical protein